jgi:hypothetical protein
MSKPAKPMGGPKKQKSKLKKQQESIGGKVVKVSISKLQTHLSMATKLDKFNSLDPTLKESFIPYLLPSFMKGTQIVEIRLPLTAYKITVVTATNYTTVLAIDASKFNNFSDCANLFDEYRVVRGEVSYYTTYTAITGTCWGAAAIDYSIATAFGSFDAANAHDTAKVGSFNNFSAMDHGSKRYTWPMKFEPLPDQQWTPVTTSNTAFCYWKPYLLGVTIGATEDLGHLLGWVDFQFRGMAG